MAYYVVVEVEGTKQKCGDCGGGGGGKTKSLMRSEIIELQRSRKGRKVSKTWCFKVGQKYSTARRIFNSLLGVSYGDETLRLVIDILHNTYLLYSMRLQTFEKTYPDTSASCVLAGFQENV